MVPNLLSQQQVPSYQRQHLQQTFQPVQPVPQPTQDRQKLENVAQQLVPNVLTQRPVLLPPSIQQQIIPLLLPPKQDFQYQFQPSVPPISQTMPNLTVTTLQPVPQGLQNSKQELEHYELQQNAPHISQTKPTSTVTTV